MSVTFIFALCVFNVNAFEKIYDIEDIEDDAIRDKFDEYPLVSRDERPSTICPVSI